MDKYESLKVSELRNIARFIGVEGCYNLRKRELIFLVMENEGYLLDRTAKSKYFPLLFVIIQRAS